MYFFYIRMCNRAREVTKISRLCLASGNANNKVSYVDYAHIHSYNAKLLFPYESAKWTWTKGFGRTLLLLYTSNINDVDDDVHLKSVWWIPVYYKYPEASSMDVAVNGDGDWTISEK